MPRFFGDNSMKEEVIYRNSTLLNIPGYHSTAAISIDLAMTSYKDNEHMPYIDGAINISDCDRRMQLDMSAYTPESTANCIHKLNSLVEILTEARNKLIKGVSDFNNRYHLAEQEKAATKKREDVEA